MLAGLAFWLYREHTREMREAARDLEFERAADLRDRIQELESERLRVG